MKRLKNFKEEKLKKLTKIKKIVLVAIFVIIIIFAICILASRSSKETLSKHENDNTSIVTTTTKPKELSESDKMLLKIVGLMDDKLTFDTGNYIKGDIPSGEYAFVKFSGSGSYYSEEDAAGNIIDNENFDSFGYVKVHGIGAITTRGVLINVSAIEQLGVTSAKEIYQILNNQENYNQGGYYKIGVDIPAGKYILESIGSGYYAIMSGPVGNSDIVDNDNFNGRAEINVREGQYLKISRAQIIQ